MFPKERILHSSCSAAKVGKQAEDLVTGIDGASAVVSLSVHV